MQKGSITVWFSLILTVMVSLISVSILTVQNAVCRVQLANCADQAMFSLFAQYDRDMLREFDLFFLDGSRNSSSFRPDALYDFLMDSADRVLHPEDYGISSLVPGSLLSRTTGITISDLTLTGGSIDGYLLATDGGGAVFEECAAAYMKEMLGITALSERNGELSSLAQKLQEYEAEGLRNEEDISDSWAELEALSAERKKAAADALDTAEDESTEDAEAGSAEIPGESGEPAVAGEENAVEELKKVGKLSVLNLVVQDPEAVSGKTVRKETLPSSRTCSEGLGILSVNLAPGMADRLLFHEYLLEHFGNYTAPCGTGLAYPMEYLLSGKDSDIGNLTSVVYKLLLIREGANLAYLYSAPTNRSSATLASEILSAVLLIPEAQPAIEALFVAGWAYCESLIDVRGLLDGDRIPLMKTADTWQLPFSRIAGFTAHMDAFRKENSSGLSYTDYLRVFLFAQSSTLTRARTLDMTEHRIRSLGRSDFRIDCCIVSLTVQFTGMAERRFPLKTEKLYDYRTL